MSGIGTRRMALRATRVIAMREIAEHWRTTGVVSLVLVSMFLAYFSAQVGVQRVAQNTDVYRSALEQLERVRARPLVQLAGWQIEPALRRLRPPAPMSALVSGLEEDLPVAWDFGPAGVRSALAPGGQADLAGLGERIDCEFVVRVLLGLLAIVIGLQCVADDRASGMLLALFTQPVTPTPVMLGKLAGGIGSMLLALAAVMLAAAAGAWPSAAAVAPARLGLLVIGAALYLITCVAFGMLMAAAFTAYRTAMVSAILAWTLAVVTLPTSGLIARAFVAESPASAVEARLDSLVQARTQAAQLEMGDALAARYGLAYDWVLITADPQSLAAALDVVEPIWEKHVRATRRLLDEEIEAVRRQEVQRNRLVRTVSVLSPAAQLTLLASTVAGVGDPQAQAWREAAAAQQVRLDAVVFDDRPRLIAFIPKTLDHVGVAGRVIVGLTRRAPPRVETLPALVAPDLSVRADAARAFGAYAWLLAYSCAALGCCVPAFRRLFRSVVR